MQSSPHSQITHVSRSKGTSANSSVTSKTQIPQIDTRQQQQQQPQQSQQQSLLEVDQSCINFMEQAQYTTVNLQPVVSTGFATPAAPIISAIPTHEVIKLLRSYFYSNSIFLISWKRKYDRVFIFFNSHLSI